MKPILREKLTWALEHIPPWDEFWKMVPPAYIRALNIKPIDKSAQLLSLFPNKDTNFNIKKDRYVDRPKKQPSQELLKHHFNYDRDVGILTWKDTGNPAGTICDSGSLLVRFMDKVYSEHRLIWCWCFGMHPEYQILHINGNREDNKIDNLVDLPYREHKTYSSNP